MAKRKETPFFAWISRYRLVAAGITLVAAVTLFSFVGSVFVPRGMADVGAARVAKPPSIDHLLGTDQ